MGRRRGEVCVWVCMCVSVENVGGVERRGESAEVCVLCVYVINQMCQRIQGGGKGQRDFFSHTCKHTRTFTPWVKSQNKYINSISDEDMTGKIGRASCRERV